MKRDIHIHFKITKRELDEFESVIKELNNALAQFGFPAITSLHKGWYHLALLGLRKLLNGRGPVPPRD